MLKIDLILCFPFSILMSLNDLSMQALTNLNNLQLLVNRLIRLVIL